MRNAASRESPRGWAGTRCARHRPYRDLCSSVFNSHHGISSFKGGHFEGGRATFGPPLQHRPYRDLCSNVFTKLIQRSIFSFYLPDRDVKKSQREPISFCTAKVVNKWGTLQRRQREMIPHRALCRLGGGIIIAGKSRPTPHLRPTIPLPGPLHPRIS